MQTTAIPNFFLYGEAPRVVDDRFLHMEALDARSRPSNWTIRPHAHGNLNHLFHITSGGGSMRAEAETLAIVAPCLLLMPAGVVHGFAFEAETVGTVLTLSDAYLQDLVRREPDFAPVFAAPAVLALPDPGFMSFSLDRLSRELAWMAPGRTAAVEALLVGMLVEALRLARQDAGPSLAGPGPQALLVARFRALVEDRYRTHAGVDDYARACRVSPKRLRAACQRIAGASPARLITSRLVLEAKRLLLYSDMTITETAYYLGFDDPAYFSRIFTKEAGLSPRSFRREAGSAR